MAEALQDIAQRPLDSIARLGGDEFAVLWLGLPASEVEGRIASLSHHFATRSAGLAQTMSAATTLSIGVAHATDTRGYGAESLLHAADVALYRAKASGRAQAAVEQLPPLQSAPQ